MNELRIAIPPGRAGFDVEQAGGNGDFHRLAYARLLVYPPTPGTGDGELHGDVTSLQGQLASNWDVAPDGRSYQIHLRPGVRSPYGNELTAEDVVWGWERAFGLRDVGKWVAIIGSVVDPSNVVALDRYTVEFRLRASNPTLLQQLTRSTPTIYDAAEARRHATADDPWAKAWLARNPAGFGSFALESCEPWRETIFRANPAGASTPAFDRVRFIAVPGRAKRLAMLRAGEIDLLLDLDPAEYLALQNVAGVQVHRARSGAHIAMMMQCQMPPFDNPLVRQAVAWAIPYRRILAQVYLGTATPWRSPLPWPTPMATEQFWRYDYDPDRARSLLTEAGFAGGFDTELFVDASNAEHGACGEIIVEALADIGIRVALERLDSGTFWFGGRYLRPFPMLIWEDWHQVPDPYYGLVHDYDPSRLGLINVGQYQSERISELIREVENEPSPVGRTALLTEAQRIIMAESPDVYLAQPAVMAATRDTIGGFFFPPDRALRFDLLTKDA